MIATLRSVVESPSAVAGGWTLLVVLWETTAIGVALAAWRAWRVRVPARQQHAAAVLAFTVALLLAAITPIVLASMPVAVAAPSPGDAVTQSRAPGASTQVAPPLGGSATTDLSRPVRARISGDQIAGMASLIWILGVAILAFRLAGGWLLAASIRRRAVPVSDEVVIGTSHRICEELKLQSFVAPLESGDVEAPVVIGWRRPALVLPTGVTRQLSTDMIAAVLTHEFAHIKRRDYLANLVQSIAELLLFFSPAFAWMSRCIRETREYCCDDLAVERCGDPRPYVQALTVLASLGAINAARPAMGISGPRLITRVRRLLHGQTMPPISRIRLGASVIVLVAVIVSGVHVTATSASRLARSDGGEASVPLALLQDTIPYGYTSEQEGSGVVFRVLSSPHDPPLARVSIRNTTNQPVAGVQFVAAAERWVPGWPRMQVRLFVSDVMAVAIPPGETVELSPGLITPDHVRELAEEAPDSRLQMFFGLSTVRYANGFEWSITPNPAARTGSDVFSSSRPQLPRALIARDAERPQVPFGVCRGDRNRATSHGGIIAIAGEPGALARCENGRWVEWSNGQ